MRESSHFDDNQTTGYNHPKNITRIEEYACHPIAFPGRYGAARTWAGMSTVFQFAAAQDFRALAEVHPNCCCLGSGSIPLPNSHEGPQGKQRYSLRQAMFLHSSKWSCSSDEMSRRRRPRSQRQPVSDLYWISADGAFQRP
ncbi:hypothetical protein [Bradyrhizobium sp. CCBAU 11430]|uniref:hypothetical protein n=1 Tax=Bradyrhizobium sp. CCBAU 11430 TaxID=1630881 RepID=UPI00230521FB|nr:hypothetical protein [Bradyrhizobium sp. CCBAU 11430]